jgi:uncharacterized membrane protein
MFPPLPSWDAMHPLIVHFPVALLLVAPVLVLLGMLLPKQSRGLFIAALVLMALGTIAGYVAVATGEAAGELAERTPGVAAVLEGHEELAQTTRLIFTALTVIFGVILFAPLLFKRNLGRKRSLALNLAFLLFYSAGTVVLVNVAHQGGRLVHEFGVRAMITTNSAPAPPTKTDAKVGDQEQKRDGHDE